MSVFCLLITGLFCLTAATNTVSAATYYVDDDADPGGDGTTADLTGEFCAFDSFTALITAMGNDTDGAPYFSGDTVNVAAGNYTEGYYEYNKLWTRTDWCVIKGASIATVDVNELVVMAFNGEDIIYPAYLQFQNLNIENSEPNGHGTWFYNVSYIRVWDCNFVGDGFQSSVTDQDYGIKAYECHHLDFNNLHIYGTGDSLAELPGIEPNDPGVPFESRDPNNFGQGWRTGIWLRWSIEAGNMTIRNCLIEQCYDCIDMAPSEGFEDYVVTNNELRYFTDNAVLLGNGGTNITITDNIIHDGMRFDADVGTIGGHVDPIQLQGANPGWVDYNNITISRNLIYDCVHQGIFLNVGGGSHTWLIENNLIYNTPSNPEGTSIAFWCYAADGVVCRHNTVLGKMVFQDGNGDLVLDEVVGNIAYNFELSNEAGVEITYENANLFFTKGPQSQEFEFGPDSFDYAVQGDFYDLFADYDNDDYTLASDSNAINLGSSSYAPSTDLLGNSRVGAPDAGCYEYVVDNQAPVLDAIGAQAVNENALLEFDVNATDADGDTITYSAANLPTGATFTSPTFSWTPDYTQADSYEVTFTVTDGSTQDSETITITVNNINRAPVLAAIGNKSANEGSLLSFSVSATDPDSDTITYSAQNLPTGATFSSQTFSWTPSYSQAGSFEVTFIASDGQEQDPETITITVGNTNRTPVLAAIGNRTVNENTTLNFSISATDADSNPITYSVEDLPSGAAFASQSFIWTPGYDQAGSFEVTFNASDGQNQDSETITITVNNVNRAPVLDAIADKSVDDGTLLTFAVNATDPDGDTIEYSATGLPSGAAFSGQTFSWTPAHSQADNSYQVTFIASDGQLQDPQAINIVVSDTSAPTVTNSLPTAGSIQTPLNNLITLNITDAGKGVNAGSVTIKVNNNIVYSGNTDKHSSIYGECYRIGTKADYRFIYQPNEMFDYDQTVSITANATDLAGNAMNEHPYSFVTEMRSFGKNKNVDSRDIKKGRPVTVCDNSGNMWAAWHAGPIRGSRDIYIGKLVVDEEYFGDIINLTEGSTADQCNPVIALDSSDKLYVAWQDDRQADDNNQGEWDIYISTSVDGISWSTETRINDPNDANQVNPAIVIDGQSPNQAYVVWQDDSTGNQDIYIAASSDGFATKTVSQITTNISDQVAPAIAADSDNTIYVVWTDTRNKGKNDIYGAASNNGPWTNIPVVIEEESQSSPAIAAEAVGSILHLVWVDDRPGDDDIFYGKTIGGLSPLAGRSIIDDSNGADQISPVIITTGYTGNDLKVFACWRDERNTDADLYCVEIGSDNETNVFVGDDGTSTDQSEPAIGIDGDGYPYLVWTNERTDICYAGSTFIESVALASTNVSISSTATVGTVWNAVNSIDDASAEVPRGAYLCDVKITISRIKNPPKSNLELDRFSGTYEFGPSGMQFIDPVTITIPYEVNGSENVSYAAYWYNTLTGTLSQEGITNVETIVISPTLHALQFKTTHFTEFLIGGGIAAAVGGGGGGGGGCSISPAGQGSIAEFLVPYIGLAAAMVIIRLRDMRNRKARNIKKG